MLPASGPAATARGGYLRVPRWPGPVFRSRRLGIIVYPVTLFLTLPSTLPHLGLHGCHLLAYHHGRWIGASRASIRHWPFVERPARGPLPIPKLSTQQANATYEYATVVREPFRLSFCPDSRPAHRSQRTPTQYDVSRMRVWPTLVMVVVVVVVVDDVVVVVVVDESLLVASTLACTRAKSWRRLLFTG